MKRGTRHHSKTERLMRILKIPRGLATGILESLWHITASEAPTGNIGKLTDDDIAQMIDCGIESRKLIAALTEAGWLDRSSTHRLVVHDWHVHADDTTKKRVQREGLKWASESIEKLPDISRQTPPASPEPAEEIPLPCQSLALPEPCPALPEPEVSPAPTRRKAAVAADPDWWGRPSDDKVQRVQFNRLTREWRGITPQDYEHWAQAYPAVDVPLELRRMAEWIIANPTKGRKSEYRAFITRWLSGTQDKGGNRPRSGGGRLFPAGGSGHFAAEARRDAKAASEFTGQVVPRVI